MAKRFALKADEIRTLAPGRGSCFASDRITVDRMPVGFMYREAGDNELDSGWRFFAGDESDEYCEDSANFSLYDVNTIANYDQAIIPLLDAAPGSAFERDPASGRLLLSHIPSGDVH
jgi:hypothetical protein